MDVLTDERSVSVGCTKRNVDDVARHWADAVVLGDDREVDGRLFRTVGFEAMEGRSRVLIKILSRPREVQHANCCAVRMEDGRHRERMNPVHEQVKGGQLDPPLDACASVEQGLDAVIAS